MTPLIFFLVVCAILLLGLGALLMFGVVVLWIGLRMMGEEEVSVAYEFPAAQAPPVPPGLAGNALGTLDTGVPVVVEDEDEDDDDGGKTEVFMRGNLNLNWDQTEQEDGATEIFRSEDYSVD